MNVSASAKLLRIHIGEADRTRHRPLFEVIVAEARAAGLGGATVLRGIESFGASSVVHRARLLELSEDLPIIVEIVDAEEKIRAFLSRIDPILEEAGCGVLMTMEKVDVVRYAAKKALQSGGSA
jgi:PII-like signaling protein